MTVFLSSAMAGSRGDHIAGLPALQSRIFPSHGYFLKVTAPICFLNLNHCIGALKVTEDTSEGAKPGCFMCGKAEVGVHMIRGVTRFRLVPLGTVASVGEDRDPTALSVPF